MVGASDFSSSSGSEWSDCECLSSQPGSAVNSQAQDTGSSRKLQLWMCWWLQSLISAWRGRASQQKRNTWPSGRLWEQAELVGKGWVWCPYLEGGCAFKNDGEMNHEILFLSVYHIKCDKDCNLNSWISSERWFRFHSVLWKITGPSLYSYKKKLFAT